MFITDARQQVTKLLNSLEAEVDFKEARVTAHRWSGAAGQVGCEEMRIKAMHLETVLRENGSYSQSETRDALEYSARRSSPPTFPRYFPAGFSDSR